jgi:hypothetical protein
MCPSSVAYDFWRPCTALYAVQLRERHALTAFSIVTPGHLVSCNLWGVLEFASLHMCVPSKAALTLALPSFSRDALSRDHALTALWYTVRASGSRKNP